MLGGRLWGGAGEGGVGGCWFVCVCVLCVSLRGVFGEGGGCLGGVLGDCLGVCGGVSGGCSLGRGVLWRGFRASRYISLAPKANKGPGGGSSKVNRDLHGRMARRSCIYSARVRAAAEVQDAINTRSLQIKPLLPSIEASLLSVIEGGGVRLDAKAWCNAGLASITGGLSGDKRVESLAYAWTRSFN